MINDNNENEGSKKRRPLSLSATSTASKNQSNDTKDAFQLPMKRQRIKSNTTLSESSESRFCLCPAGCGRHILLVSLERHLNGDNPCTKASIAPTETATTTTIDAKATPARTISTKPSVVPRIVSPKEKQEKQSQSGQTNWSTKDRKEEEACDSVIETYNLFEYMKDRASQVFSKKRSHQQQQRHYQSFHLQADGTVRLICHRNDSGSNLTMSISPHETNTSIEWSTNVQLRQRHEKSKNQILHSASSSSATTINLFISSEIPSQQGKQQYVHKHSRLSIPVLKSILQKSIRRRKPLPSVRVALELADKSLSDLLRRLPIILLEDSFLHPLFPLLIWLMIAESKGFYPSSFLMTKVFRIVYETCLCPWKDIPVPFSYDGDDDDDDDEMKLTNDDNSKSNTLQYEGGNGSNKNGTSRKLSLINFTPFENGNQSNSTQDCYELDPTEKLLWAMLARATYGGMSCDIRLLHSFAWTWKQRFDMDAKILPSNKGDENDSDNSIYMIPKVVAVALMDKIGDRSNIKSTVQRKLQWNDVLFALHRQSSWSTSSPFTRIASMVQHGISKLEITDITNEGIDFHCSGIVAALLSNRNVVERCHEKLQLKVPSNSQRTLDSFQSNLVQDFSEANEKTLVMDPNHNAQLEDIVKQCIWTFCSSVNHRLLLPSTPQRKNSSNVDEKEEEHQKRQVLKELWNTVIEPNVKTFAKRYVTTRLAH